MFSQSRGKRRPKPASLPNRVRSALRHRPLGVSREGATALFELVTEKHFVKVAEVCTKARAVPTRAQG